jgi:uncharacterized protein GlcG (DUF336 family)
MNISFKQAGEVVGRATAQANAIRVPMNIAVLDGGGHLKAFVRMDGALLGSIDVAIGKARTSVLFSMNSEGIWDFCKPDLRAWSIPTAAWFHSRVGCQSQT